MDEINQVLRGINKLGALRIEQFVEFVGHGTGKHTSVDADSGIFGAVDEPCDPILGTIAVTGLDAYPMVVDLFSGLDPVPRVGDEVRSGF
jgi:hypothetical protein